MTIGSLIIVYRSVVPQRPRYETLVPINREDHFYPLQPRHSDYMQYHRELTVFMSAGAHHRILRLRKETQRLPMTPMTPDLASMRPLPTSYTDQLYDTTKPESPTGQGPLRRKNPWGQKCRPTERHKLNSMEETFRFFHLASCLTELLREMP